MSAPESAAIAKLSERVESIADSVDKLVAVVAEDRRTNIENIKGVYNDLGTIRDRLSGAGRITWPLICTTFSAMLGFSALIGGLGSYALKSESQIINNRIDGLATHLAQRAENNALGVNRSAEAVLQMHKDFADLRERQAAMNARQDAQLEFLLKEKPTP